MARTFFTGVASLGKKKTWHCVFCFLESLGALVVLWAIVYATHPPRVIYEKEVGAESFRFHYIPRMCLGLETGFPFTRISLPLPPWCDGREGVWLDSDLTVLKGWSKGLVRTDTIDESALEISNMKLRRKFNELFIQLSIQRNLHRDSLEDGFYEYIIEEGDHAK